VHSPSVDQGEIWTAAHNFDVHAHASPSNSFSAAANRSTSSTVCDADNEMRRRASPLGTVGGRIAGTQMPRSRSASLVASAESKGPGSINWL